jgi:hypothetical protein
MQLPFDFILIENLPEFFEQSLSLTNYFISSSVPQLNPTAISLQLELLTIRKENKELQTLGFFSLIESELEKALKNLIIKTSEFKNKNLY